MGNTQSTSSQTYISPPPSRKPQPFVGSFFDGQLAVPLPHTQATKPNRSPAHINYFEVASATIQPAKSTPSSFNSSTANTKKSSNSTTLYPTTTNNSSKTLPASSSSVQQQPAPSPLDQKYTTINNRRYWKGHGSQNFILPCDDDEIDRIMTMVIALFLYSCIYF